MLTVRRPDGSIAGQIARPATAEAILRVAYGLGDEDALCALAGPTGWRLNVVRPGQPAARRVEPLADHGAVPVERCDAERAEDVLTEAAWADLIERGWLAVDESATVRGA